MKYDRHLVLLASWLCAASASAQRPSDFRAIRGGDKPGVIDVGTMVTDGDVRTFDMYMREGEDMPGNNVRARTSINCRDHTESITSVAKQSGPDTGFDITHSVSEPWAKADGDPTGARIVDLVCAQAADRDRYARPLSTQDWHSALAAAMSEKSE
ncbi:hypothetical protein LZK98_04875 [Sphingomonas cannabina]|uniref:hypothetical protein n=1 Tax=Sphingomonas cannabina TaxID=2899123 RepID=UPI001F1CF2AC|nr:hypothetical protein [Sphingomonas cannabina]UIJ46282.1 hypothetical protein LZK98_04875 [Sphingomonas cannabina]